jgi:hypothetical protein
MAARLGFLRNNVFLVAAVALPVLVIGFFLLASAIPRWLVSPPAYDLLLRVGKPSGPRAALTVVDYNIREGHVEATVRPALRNQYEQTFALFVFDHATQNLTEVPVSLPDTLPEDSGPRLIVVDALAGRRILQQAKAPDGYELQTGRWHGAGLVGELFGMHTHDPSATLVNKGRIIPIPLPPGYEYLSPVSAIGWLADAR